MSGDPDNVLLGNDCEEVAGETFGDLNQPGVTLLNPMKWGWPAVGPIQNMCDLIDGEDTKPLPLSEQLSGDDCGYENNDSMDTEAYQNSLSPLNESKSEFGVNKSVVTRNKSFSDNIKKALHGGLSPTCSEDIAIPTIENPHLVNIECEVVIGNECFPLSKTWDLSLSEGYSLNNDICFYARQVSLELGIPFHEEWRLVASIQEQLDGHVKKLVEWRHLQFEDKYGNKGSTKLEGALGKEDGAITGPSVQSELLLAATAGVSESNELATKSSGSKKQGAVSVKRKLSNEKTQQSKKEKKSEIQKKNKGEEIWVEVMPEDHNTDICGICSTGGDLLCCDRCPRAFHLKCLKVEEEDLPPGDWICQGKPPPSLTMYSSFHP